MGPGPPGHGYGLGKPTLIKLQLDFNGVEACADFRGFSYDGFYENTEVRGTVSGIKKVLLFLLSSQ